MFSQLRMREEQALLAHDYALETARVEGIEQGLERGKVEGRETFYLFRYGMSTCFNFRSCQSAVVAAAVTLNAAPVHAYGNWSGWDGSAGNPTHHDGVVAPANQYKPAKPVTNPRGSNDNGYGTPTHTKGTVADGVATLSDVEPGTAVAYRLNVPAGYEEDSYNGHVTAVAGNVPATFSIRPATLQNNCDTIHPAQPGQSYGEEVKSPWVKDDKGQWSYVLDEKGTKATSWKQIDGKWYFFNAEGVMQKWWVKDGNTWYYLNGSGEMQTGWLLDGGKWYFLEASGAMKASQWFQVKDKWYHVDGSGALSVNTTVDGYTVNGNGEWV